MLPAAVVLLLFLTYPLGLGTWLGFTDTKIGRGGEWIGLENYEFLWGDAVTRLSLFNTLFYTVVASIIKFVLGLWLALLLNKHLPFKSFIRAIVLLPFIVPTALSAIAFWWIYDAQFSIISWTLVKLGWIDRYIDFLGEPWLARLSVIAANIWRGVPFVAICLLAGLQTISPSYYEAASLDGATDWQQFRFVTLPLLTPIIAVVMTFSVLFTFTDFQLIYVLTRGGPLNATHLMATLVFQRAIPGRRAGRRRRARDRDGAVPAGGDPVPLLRTAAARLAAGRAGQISDEHSHPATPGHRLPGHEVPRVRCRAALVTVYLPLAVFLIVLLFPFYWMTITAFKPNEELLSREGNPFWVINPTLAHIKKLLFDTAYPDWLWNTMLVSVVSTLLSLFCSVLAAYAIERLRFRGSRYVGMSIFLAYLVPPSILFIPLAAIIFSSSCSTRASR